MLLQTGLFDHNKIEVFIWLEELTHLRSYQRKKSKLYVLSWLGQLVVETAKDPLGAIDEMLTVQSEITDTAVVPLKRNTTSFDFTSVLDSEDVCEDLTVEGKHQVSKT